MLVGDAPDKESELMGEAFAGRQGTLLRKLLHDAGINPGEAHMTYAADKSRLWAELKELRPKIVVTLGVAPTSLLLKLTKSVRLSDFVGTFHRVAYMTALVAPWYHPSYLLQRGKGMAELTVSFFRSVKERIESV